MSLLEISFYGLIVGSIANVVLYHKWQAERRLRRRIQNDGMVD